VYGEANLSLAGVISLVISRIMPISAFIYILHKTHRPEAATFIPYLIAYIFVVCLRMAVPIFFRFFNYFEIMLIIAITQTMQYTRPKTLLRYLAVFMLSSMVLIRTYELTKPEGEAKVYNRYVPYNSVFSQDYNERSESIFRYY
jgi:phosphoglycerol transferase MdoB-like AlkP superfamily enzyme